MKYCIGIDIGGTKSAVILGIPDANRTAAECIIEKKSFQMKQGEPPEKTIGRLKTLIYEITEKRSISQNQIAGIGISCGGPLDSGRGIILSPPNLPGWSNISIVSILEEEFGFPVVLENDANACAVAEWKYGAGRGCKNLIFLTFGTGMGAGLILDGKLYRGTSGMAGEAGHIRLENQGPEGFGKRGSFEGFCSGGGISRLARMNGLPFADAKETALAADRQDPHALEVYRTSGAALGKALAILVDLLNPEKIIIGSIFQRSGHLLWPSAEKVLKEEALADSLAVCQIVPSELGDSVGDMASLSLAAYHFGEGD